MRRFMVPATCNQPIVTFGEVQNQHTYTVLSGYYPMLCILKVNWCLLHVQMTRLTKKHGLLHSQGGS